MEKKCSYVALVGAPNAGKSTLLNALIGTKLSIVSPKVQTTRDVIRGIATAGAAQLIFVDTPGIFESEKKLDKQMVRAAWDTMQEVDCILVVIDAARGIDPNTDKILRSLAERKDKKIPAVVVLNKIDRINAEQLLPLTQEVSERGDFDRIFMVSALKNKGVNDIKIYLEANAPVRDWEFAEDQISDSSMRFLAAEFTREQLFRLAHQELPYAIKVETELWEEKKGGKGKNGQKIAPSVKIHQVIYVMREGQKKIIIGKGGELLKRAGEQSRYAIEKLLGCKVHLFLFVKVKEDWQEKEVPGD